MISFRPLCIYCSFSNIKSTDQLEVFRTLTWVVRVGRYCKGPIPMTMLVPRLWVLWSTSVKLLAFVWICLRDLFRGAMKTWQCRWHYSSLRLIANPFQSPGVLQHERWNGNLNSVGQLFTSWRLGFNKGNELKNCAGE